MVECFQVGTGSQTGTSETILAQYFSNGPIYEINSIALSTGNGAEGYWEFTYLQGSVFHQMQRCLWNVTTNFKCLFLLQCK